MSSLTQSQHFPKLGFTSASLRSLFLELAVHVQSAFESMGQAKAVNVQPAYFSSTPLADMARLEVARALLLIRDPRPVKDAMSCLTGKNASAWAAKLLEVALDERPDMVETEHLRTVAGIPDPMEKIPAVALQDLKIGPTWEVYRTIDCSRLRQLAKLELGRRQEPRNATSPAKGSALKRAAHS